MKNKQKLVSLALTKKTISNLNVIGGNFTNTNDFPDTDPVVCATIPIICNPPSPSENKDCGESSPLLPIYT